MRYCDLNRMNSIMNLIEALNSESKYGYMTDHLDIWEVSLRTKYENYGKYYEKEILEPLQKMSDRILYIVDKEAYLIDKTKETTIYFSLNLISAMRSAVQVYLLFNNIDDGYEKKNTLLEKMNDIDQILETKYNQIWRSYFRK